MTHIEENEFTVLFGEFIKDHNMKEDEVKQFQEDIGEIVNNVCTEHLNELEEKTELMYDQID